MTILENPRANPGLGRAIFHQLADVGGKADREALLRTVAPPGAGWYEPKKDGDARDETITVFKAIGVFKETKSGGISLAVPPDDWGAAADVPTFRRLVRRRLFESVGEANPFDRGGLPAFAGAIAWLLIQDPVKPFGAWGKSTRGLDPEGVQLANLGQARRLITNEFQWPVFARWAIFLGFAAPLRLGKPPEFTVPDPSVAIHDEAEVLVGGDAAKSIASLASVLPVLDGGLIRGSVEAHWRGDPPPALVSPSLGVALVRLEMEGRLEFDNVPDARSETRVVLNLRSDSRTVSSISPRAHRG